MSWAISAESKDLNFTCLRVSNVKAFNDKHLPLNFLVSFIDHLKVYQLPFEQSFW